MAAFTLVLEKEDLDRAGWEPRAGAVHLQGLRGSNQDPSPMFGRERWLWTWILAVAVSLTTAW